MILPWNKVLDDLRFDPKLAAMPSTWCIVSYGSPALVSESAEVEEWFCSPCFQQSPLFCVGVSIYNTLGAA